MRPLEPWVHLGLVVAPVSLAAAVVICGLFSTPTSVVSSPNVPHQYLDRDRYPPRALRRYSVPDARKRDFGYLRQRPFRPSVPTLSPYPEAGQTVADSELFRSTPRTCGCFRGILSLR